MNPYTKRILCVDDEEETLDMLCGLLGLVNCEVSRAATVAEALEMIAADGGFDLYLLDYWLPGGSGTELCRKIRESDPHTPVVFYSGASLDSEREEALAAGAQAYLVKPRDLGLLLETVGPLLR